MMFIMKTIEVNLKETKYNIYIENNIICKIGEEIKKVCNGNKVAIITDHNVKALYGEDLKQQIEDREFSVRLISIDPGEKSKNLKNLEKLYEKLCHFNLTRNDIIITLGGGVVGDIGGFLAATYLRGVPYIQIPTSILSQVDSSVGGKVGVDLAYGKNLVGTFYQPKAVFIDPMVLSTLSEKFLCDGLGEVVKYGFIKDRTIIDDLMNCKDYNELLQHMEEIIYKCCDIKKTFVEEDEKDLGVRMVLNFGHTIGHGIEKYFNYDKYSHGEAVAIGMARITEKIESKGIAKKGTFSTMKKVLERYNLPYTMPDMDKKELIRILSMDKKNYSGYINLILIEDIGKAFIKKVSIDELENYI